MREWWEDKQLLDALRISMEDYVAMVSQLAGEDPAPGRSDQRKYPRLRYWYRDVTMRLHRQGRPSIPYAVKAHNISARGLAFLSGFYVQTGTRADLALRTTQERIAPVSGKVARCRHLGGKVHEIGVEFERPIELREFLPEKVLPAQQETQGGEPERFRGRVLYMDHSNERRTLVRFLGRELGVEVRAVSAPEEVLRSAADETFDIILLKPKAADAARELVSALRAHQCPAHIAVIAAPAGAAAPNLEAEIVQAGCNCVMTSPLTQPRLAELFGGVLARESGEATAPQPLVSSMWGNVKMRPLILTYVAQLDEQLRQLQGLVAGAQREEVGTACREWQDSAEAYGFGPLATTLQELASLVATDVPVNQLTSKVAELSRLCQAAHRVMKP